MIPSKTFLFYLLDTPTGKVYYRDSSNTTQLVNIETAGVPVDLKHAPGNWLNTSLAFDRNMTYFGLNRAYATPQEFVLDVKDMIQELTLFGVGVEKPLSLAVFKLNTVPQAGEPTYKLYFKAPLDLPQAIATIFETFSCNLMEGGVTQLLKNYENTPLTIPCDGSLPEHIKANYDGMLVQDSFYYQFVPFTNSGGARSILPSVFLNNEGDNFGIVHNNPDYDTILNYSDPGTFFQLSPNWICYSSSQIQLEITGDIVVRSDDNSNIPFSMNIQTSKNATSTIVVELVPSANSVSATTRYEFSTVVTLQPNEKMFFSFFGGDSDSHLQVVGGQFSYKFVSKCHNSRAWGMTAYDLWRLIGEQICDLASTTDHPVSYEFTSELLKQYLNFFITSGDALRASNDPTYQRYYFVDENNNTDFGPVIKISLKQFYESIRVPLMAAVGRSSDPITNKDQLFLETLQSVFDSSVVNYSLGEVSHFRYELHSKDFRFSDLSIGYPPQTYDQKAGKYEWNTRLKMKAPIKSFEKQLTLESFIRWDAYGIERLRAGAEVSASTSTTRNDSDNSVFGTVIDRDHFIYDYFNALFSSLISTDTDPNNTNIHFAAAQDFQKIDMPITDGEYFAVNKDFGIFVFSIPGYSATESTNIKMNATANSINKPPLQPDDTVTVKFWRNGVVLYSATTTITGINTPIDPAGLGSVGGVTFSQLYEHSDCIYITVETSATAEVQINTVDLAIGTYVTMSGANIPVLGGIGLKVISMPTVVPASIPYDGSSVVQSGYQYFQYNSLAFANNFDMQLGLTGYDDSEVANFVFNIYINGVLQTDNITIAGTVSRSFFSAASVLINRSYDLNDIVFITASNAGASLQMYIQTSLLTWTSTYTKAYNLYRIQYDSLQGLPLLVQDGGVFRTDLPGSPYNIEYVSPARCRDKWTEYLNSCFVDEVTGELTFQTLDKNSYLSTSKGSVTITESGNKTLLTGGRLFYPIPVEMEFYCPLTFAEMQSQLSNGHLHFTYFGKDFYFHVMHIEQKGALNDTTTAKGLLSPLVSLSDLVNLTAFKQPDMNPNTIKYDFLNPIQFVPINQTQPAKYKTFNRNEFFFKDQITRWAESGGYAQPVQIGDLLTLQFITRDLDPITYTVYRCNGTIYTGPTNLDTIPTSTFANPYILWQKYIDTSAWPAGAYYIVISATTGDQLISELLDVREDWPDTVLIEFTSSQNIGQMVFISDVPFNGSMRIQAMFDNTFKQLYAGKFYTDQTQDSTILNAIPFEETELYVIGDAGVPDYVAKKVLRMLLCDGCKLDGEGYSILEGAEMEPVFTIGAPKKFQKLKIRPKENLFSIDVDAGVTDTDVALMITLDQVALGPNQTNASGSTDPVLIDIPVNP